MCEAALEDVLDLGEQCLGGQFPLPDEPDPPRCPLVLARCTGCHLVQLRHTVEPGEMFTQYGYRSGVTQTMRRHLRSVAGEAAALAAKRGQLNVLDIGCNDGTLLDVFPVNWRRVGIDPSQVADEASRSSGWTFLKGRFPEVYLAGSFDLVFTVACFYGADDPVGFARAVRDRLAPDGLWCVEVADLGAMIDNVAYDGICHEHLCYYTIADLCRVARRAGLWLKYCSANTSNGGSVRAYFGHTGAVAPPVTRTPTDEDLAEFAANVKRGREDLEALLYESESQWALLGASTKVNTLLQYTRAGEFMDHASDRDPRKAGRVTPGTRIPIVSEEESRAKAPDYYLVGPWHFREEIIARERAAGTKAKLVFPLPELEIVDLQQQELSCP